MPFYARNRKSDGKYQLLEEHLLETSELAGIFAKTFSFEELAFLSGILHDLGKNREEWQTYLQNNIAGKKQNKLDHSTAGSQFVKQKFSEDEFLSKLKLSQLILETVIMFHHGSGLPDMIGLDGDSEFLNKLEKSEIDSGLLDCEKNISKSIQEKIDNLLKSEKLKSEEKVFLESCKKNCISSNGKIYDKKFRFNIGLHLRNFSSCLIDADRTDSALFDSAQKFDLQQIKEKYEKISDWKSLLSKLENKLSTFENETELGKIRNELSSSCFEFGQKKKGIYSCSAMTGSGKTLASLRFALKHALTHNLKKIFIIAPYTSIIDQNAEEIRKILEDEATKGKIVLECHSNLSEEKENDIYGDDFKTVSETWDAPIIVTTMVQFLETLFGSGTKQIRRMHNLAESVVIFDEIQTLPVKCTYLFNWGIEYLVNCCKSSALLCTATQPGLDKIGNDENFRLNLLKENEVIKNVFEHYESLQRVEFIDKTNFGTKKSELSEVVDYIKDKLEECKSFLAVVNTKPQAKELFEKLKESKCADEIYHLSTNMCPAHRKEIFAEIRKNIKNKKIICVSTRLIEAGVDLSFGGALRYLAGLDSIIQTAGRCNRHGEMKGLGKVAIFDVENENLGSLEELKNGQEAILRILHESANFSEKFNLLNPSIIQKYFDYYYGLYSEGNLKYSFEKESSTIVDLLSDNLESCNEHKRIKDEKSLKKFIFLTQSFKTAWNKFEVIADNTIGVIAQFKEGQNLVGQLKSLDKYQSDYYEKISEILKKSQQFSVNVFANQITKLLKEGSIFEVIKDSGIYATSEGFYGEEIGLSKEFVGSTINLF